MINVRRGILVAVFSLLANTAFARDIDLKDFGVIPDSYLNASPALAKALRSAKGDENVVLRFPGGRIDFWPDGAEKRELYISNTTEDDTLSKVKNLAICLDHFSGITIEGNNTLVVLHGKMISFGIFNSRNVTIKDISFDYERPSMSEMTVLSVSDSLVKVNVNPDTRYFIEEGKIGFFGEGWKNRIFHTVLFNPQNGTMRYCSFAPFLQSKATDAGCREVLFHGNFSNAGLHPGEVLTVRDTYRDNCGAFICHSGNVRLENVRMNYMHGLGIVSQFSENISFKKVNVVPREETGRVVAAFADCFHFSGCRGLIELDSCRTSGSHDDPVNVHGTHLKIVKIENGNRLIVRFMHAQTYGFEAFFAGDSVGFVQPESLLVYDYRKIKTARLISKREMILEADRPLPVQLKEGDCLENITWTPEVKIRNCCFERTNTRGILVTTRRPVLIENNTFSRIGMHAILIADDASSWFESGPVADVTIRNNVFEDCGYNSAPDNYVIAIKPEAHTLVPGCYVHRNIRIENNTFKVYDYPVLSALSVDNMKFTGNKVLRDHFMKTGDPRPGFMLTACKNIIIEKNWFPEGWNAVVRTSKMNKRDIVTDLPN